MINFLHKFLSISFLIYGLYGCNINHSQESTKSTSLKDTSAEVGMITDVDTGLINDAPELLTAAEEENITSIEQIYKKCRKRASVFVINSDRDTVISCKEGTLISIPANSFERAKDQSSIEGAVKLAVTEYYTVSDMVLANLATSSGSKLIESGGMFSISARAKDNNDSLTLKKGKDINIALPTSNSTKMDGMQLFNGVHDSDGINWEPGNGSLGYAQRWNSRGGFSVNNIYENFNVFPDEGPKKMPVLHNNAQKTFTTEIRMSLREIIQNSGNVNFSRSAMGYIDTTGILHGYLTGNKRIQFKFETDYTPSFSENVNVNVAVSFKVKIHQKNNINFGYFDKLFKMGKGNPDSLIAVAIDFIPAIKKINYEKIKNVYNRTISLSLYQKNLSNIKKSKLAHERHIRLLEKNALNSMHTAQEYLMLNTQKLGWINCDRFNNTISKTDYMVKLTEKTSLLIVFNNIMSILTSDSKGVFHNVPLGEKITIIALKTDQGKIMLAMHETVITEKPFEDLEFRRVTLNEYKSKIQKLNRI